MAFTQTVYGVEEANPDKNIVLVPFPSPVASADYPLLQVIFQLMLSPSGSLIGILQVRLNGVPVEPFVGEGIPNTGGVLPPLPCVVNV